MSEPDVIEVQRTADGQAVLGREHDLISPRIVRVAGTTMISLIESMTVSRVRSKTGLRLSGWANVYHRISPRRIQPLPALRFPSKRIVIRRELIGFDRRGRIRCGIIGRSERRRA